MPDNVRLYVADVSAAFCVFLAELAGPRLGCWLMNDRWSPIHHVVSWAFMARYTLRGPPAETFGVPGTSFHVLHFG